MTDNQESLINNPLTDEVDSEASAEQPQAQPEPPATPEDIASTFITLFHAKAIAGIGRLSNKDLRRVLTALIEVPLLRPEHGIVNEEAKNVYLWVDQIIKSKTMLELSVLYGSGVLDQIPQEVNPDVKEDNNTTTTS